MDPDPTDPSRIIEVWFSGNHSNVGGGYSTDKLSDITLDFLLRHISSDYGQTESTDETWGLYVRRTLDREEEILPDPAGKIRHSTGPVYEHAPRKPPLHAVIHDSVFDRMAAPTAQYTPESLFNLNRELLTKRGQVGKELAEIGTGSGTDGPISLSAFRDRLIGDDKVDWLRIAGGTETLTDGQCEQIWAWVQTLKVTNQSTTEVKQTEPLPSVALGHRVLFDMESRAEDINDLNDGKVSTALRDKLNQRIAEIEKPLSDSAEVIQSNTEWRIGKFVVKKQNNNRLYVSRSPKDGDKTQ